MSHPRNDALKRYAKAHGLVLKSVQERPDGVLVLSLGAPDPFYLLPRDRRAGEWAAAQFDRFGHRGHIRRLHYAVFAAGDVITPQDRLYGSGDYHGDWMYLGRGARAARYMGLVDPEDLDDARNAELVENVRARLDDPEPAVVVRDLVDDRWRVPHVPETITDPRWSVPQLFDVLGYEHARIDQPVHLVVAIEKSTMGDILDPLCEGLGVDLLTGTGHESITRIVQLLRRAEDLDRHVHVLYISDCDRNGRSMPFQMARQLQFWAEQLGVSHRFTLEPIALTREQVDRYAAEGRPLPANPDRPDQIELDALHVVIPGELQRIVREAVARYRDRTIQGRLEDAQTQARTVVDEAWKRWNHGFTADLDEIRTAVNDVNARFRQRQADIAREYSQAIAPHRERLDVLWQRMIDQAGEIVDDVELPDRPESQPVEIADGVLFDSERDWLDALAAFVRAANGNGDQA